ncbi:uncharacterized protein GIQ15_06785 [Arthroderma uncinatum]|uniref:uncharacterized protein n=1 Tax=Arthroderma uncinatum TaxID=74035 RepID=UPI00144AA9E4|nr:uncharacterized protein GIQ15_06785 [Arthroderma uncinatum]KAF3479809.1 hypothetical protein GIQ15_06785 [Arthroderma uncinatum]
MATPQRTTGTCNFEPPTGPRAAQIDMSRDPRRMPRNEPPSQNNPPAPTVQDTVRVLRQLTEEVAEVTNIKGARDRLMRKRRTEEQTFRKAKERGHAYPSLLQSLRSGMEDRDKELKRIEERFNTRTAKKENLMLSLANLIHNPPSKAPQHDQVAEDLRKTNADLLKIKDEISSMKESNNLRHSAMEERASANSQILDKLKGDLEFNSNSMKQHVSEIGSLDSRLVSFQASLDRIKVLSATLEAFKLTMKNDIDIKNTKLESLEKKVREITETLDTSKSDEQTQSNHAAEELRLNMKAITEQVNAMVEASKNQFSRIDEVVKSKISIIEKDVNALVKDKIPSLEVQATNSAKAIQDSALRRSEASLNNLTPSPIPISDKTIRVDMQTLSDEIDGLREIQKSKDELLSKALDDAQLAMDKFSQDIIGLRQTVASINPQALNHKFNELHGHFMGNINALNKQIAAAYAAVHSLEDRYSQLTTEPIVRQMVLAMQEMYPHASKVEADIVNILQTVNEHLTQIKAHSANISVLEAAQVKAKEASDGLIAFLHTEKKEITGQMKTVQSKTDELEESFLQSLAEHGADLRSTMEELKDIKAQVQMMTVKKPVPTVPQAQTSREMSSTTPSEGHGRSSTPQSDLDRHRHKKRKRDMRSPSHPESNNPKLGDR